MKDDMTVIEHMSTYNLIQLRRKINAELTRRRSDRLKGASTSDKHIVATANERSDDQ